MSRREVILFEDWGWTRLLPLVYNRGVFQLVCGMGPLWDSVRRVSGTREIELWTRESIAELTRERLGLAVNQPARDGALFLNGRARWRRLPDEGGDVPAEGDWVGTVEGDRLACISATPELARRLSPAVLLDEAQTNAVLAGLPRVDVGDALELFDWPWELVDGNPGALVEDWLQFGERLEDDGRVDAGAYLLNRSAIRIGSGSRVKPCVVIDAESGPVVLGRNVTIQPHCYVEGPAFIGDGTLLQPGAVIRGGVTIGPVCKVGGEVEGSVLIGYSNKQHDGFLGHGYIGSFVNIAADCINSDLKNTYGTVRVPINGHEVETGRKFVGLTVGDHSKAGINVSFPTGAVMGFCSSIVGAICPKFVPSFSWIESGNLQRYDAARGLAIAKTVMGRRSLTMTPAEEAAFLAVRTEAMTLEHDSQLWLG